MISSRYYVVAREIKPPGKSWQCSVDEDDIGSGRGEFLNFALTKN